MICEANDLGAGNGPLLLYCSFVRGRELPPLTKS